MLGKPEAFTIRAIALAGVLFALAGTVAWAAPASAPASSPAKAADLPPGALMRFGGGSMRCAGPITALAFSADSRWIGTGSLDAKVRLWDATTGTKVNEYPGVWQNPMVSFSPDGRRFAYLTAQLRPAKTGYIAQEALVVDDLVTGKCIANVALGRTDSFAWLPSGFAVSTAGNIECYDPLGKSVQRGKHEGLRHIASAPDGKTIGCFGFEKLGMWDPQTQGFRSFCSLTPNTKGVPRQTQARAVAFTADCKTLWVVCAGGEILAFNVEATKAEATELCRMDALAGAAAFSQDMKAVYCYEGGVSTEMAPSLNSSTLCRCDSSTGRRTWRAGPVPDVRVVAVSPDGKLLAAGCGDGLLWIYDAATGKLLFPKEARPAVLTRAAVSPDGQIVAVGAFDGSVTLFGGADGKVLFTLSGHDEPIEAVGFSPDGACLASYCEDGRLCLWAPATGKKLVAIETHTGRKKYAPGAQKPAPHSDLSFSADSTFVVAAGLEGGLLVDVRTAKLKSALPPLTGGCIRISAQDVQYAGCSGTVIYDLKQGKFGKAHFKLGSSVMGIVGPDGKLGATGGTLWDLGTHTELNHLRPSDPPKGVTRATAFSADGQLVARAEDLVPLTPEAGAEAHLAPYSQIIRIFDTRTGDELLRREGHEGKVRGMAFGPAGKKLYTCGTDGVVLVWQVPPVPPLPAPPALNAGQAAQALGTEPSQAFATIRAMVAHPPEAIAIIRKQLYGADEQLDKPLWAPLAAWVAADAAGRKALDASMQRGLFAEGGFTAATRAILNPATPADARQQLREMMDKVYNRPDDPSYLSLMRMMIVLGRLDHPDAEPLLKAWAEALPAQWGGYAAADTLLQRSTATPKPAAK